MTVADPWRLTRRDRAACMLALLLRAVLRASVGDYGPTLTVWVADGIIDEKSGRLKP